MSEESLPSFEVSPLPGADPGHHHGGARQQTSSSVGHRALQLGRRERHLDPPPERAQTTRQLDGRRPLGLRI